MSSTSVTSSDDLQPGLQQDAQTAAPSGQLPPVDPELFERAREAVTVIRGAGRQANGQAGQGNTIAMKDGFRSLQLMNHPDIATWYGEQIEAISTDLGGDAELSALARAAVREVARLEVIVAALGDELLKHGVLTGKGKTRSATNCYLKALDRFVKLAGVLGLARQQKRVPSLTEVLADGE